MLKMCFSFPEKGDDMTKTVKLVKVVSVSPVLIFINAIFYQITSLMHICNGC
jgi:hypothetical protein